MEHLENEYNELKKNLNSILLTLVDNNNQNNKVVTTTQNVLNKKNSQNKNQYNRDTKLYLYYIDNLI